MPQGGEESVNNRHGEKEKGCGGNRIPAAARLSWGVTWEISDQV
jgi:hypothetical protein